MKKKKTLLSVATGVLLCVSLSFGAGVGATGPSKPDKDHTGGGSKPPACTTLPNPCLPT